MSTWLRDPLLVKEVRTRLRARTALIVEELYVCALGLVTLLTMLAGGFSRPAWEAGEALFTTLAYSQAVLMLFVAPLVAASAVSGEREQKTFDSLMVTPVSPRRVILIKLVSVLAVFVILMAVSLPFAAAAYLLGGVSLRSLAVGWSYALLLTTTAGAMGLYWSTRFDRSVASIPAAAVCTVLLGVIAPVFARGGSIVLGCASPILFLENVFQGGATRLFGASAPSWPIVFALLATAMAGLTAAAVQRLRFEPERRYLWMRVFGLTAWALVAAGVLGDLAGEGPAGTLRAARSQAAQSLTLALCVLSVLALWIGSNLPVIRSERCAPPGRRLALALWARMLTGPVGYTVLLSAVAGALVAVAWRVVGPMNLSRPAMVFSGACLITTPALVALLTFRLSDRRTTRGRFIGLAAGAIIAFALLLGPWIVYQIGPTPPADKPLWIQLVKLASPLTTTTALSEPHAWAKALPRAHALLGDSAVWAFAAAAHGALLALLALPIFPSETRRRGRAAPGA